MITDNVIILKMCILLTYSGVNDEESDFSFILASNRDEFYNRPAKSMAPWVEDPTVYGGLDLEAGGTWLAISPICKRIGVLLNLPGVKKENAKSRGKVVADFVKSELSASNYVECMKDYFQECNEFVFVTVEIGKQPITHTYSNANNKLDVWTDENLGFGNCLPEDPLKKVEAAKSRLADICNRLKKINQKAELIQELIRFLRCKKQYLPDAQLEKRQPTLYQQLSSIFVEVPEAKYGTRTHTLILVTKTGHIDVIEITLQAPVNMSDVQWQRTEYQFDI